MASETTEKETRKLTLFTLTWPIFIELSLTLLMGNVDTFMLSRYNDHAVASVGVANQLLSMVQIMFGFVAAGTTILVSRHLGAKNYEAARRAATTSLTLNAIFGVALSILIVLAGPSVLRLMGISEELMPDSLTFLNITGSFMFIQALILTVSAVIKSHGHTRQVMYITLGMNVTNIIGNAIFINGLFGAPVLGVAGVSMSTSFSRLLGLVAMLYLLIKVLQHPVPWRNLLHPSRKVVSELLHIGVPSAGEQLSYNSSQLVITSFIATLGTIAMVTRVYTFNIIYLITLFSIAISQSTQILVARMLGAGDKDQAYGRCLRSLVIAIGIALGMAGVYNVLGRYILDLFTDDPDVIAMGRKLLLLAFLLEPGRAFNLIIISSLRAVGDVRYPVIVGIIFMWGAAVPCSYLLGIHFGLGLFGIFIAFVLDEWTRGLIFLHRWRTRKWERFYQAPPSSAASGKSVGAAG